MSSHTPTEVPSNGADACSDVTILIHVGPHKTGTSWLQNQLFANAPGIVVADRYQGREAFLMPAVEDFSPETARAVLAPKLNAARESGKPLVISDEALCGRAFGQLFYREVIAERMARTFPHAQILVTMREQNSLLLSMYSEYLRFGYSSSLRAFLTQDTGEEYMHPLLDMTYYEWDRVHRFYERFFPAEQVHSIPMEWGLAAEDNYPTALEKILGAPLGLDAPPPVKVVDRPSLSGWALTCLRHANKTRPVDSKYLYGKGPFSPNAIAYRVNKFTPKGARKRSKQQMQTLVRELVGDHFAASNRAMQDRLGIDLASFSYKV